MHSQTEHVWEPYRSATTRMQRMWRRIFGSGIGVAAGHAWQVFAKMDCHADRRRAKEFLTRNRGWPRPHDDLKMLHLIKLCVGCDSIRDLEDWIDQRCKARRQGKAGARRRERNHTTRMVPKRAAEILDGGSLYWVIRGHILCRERILNIRPFVDKDGIGRCHIVLDCKPVPVEPRPYRAFQGWRYLALDDAPRDLDRAAPGARDMPEDLRRELRNLGLL
jgi:hypothetical protein